MPGGPLNWAAQAPAVGKTTRAMLIFRKAGGSPLYNGKITLYDTLDHRIGGVQQQQGGYAGSLTFSSQYGMFSVDTLPLVSLGSDRAIVEPAAPYYEAPEPPPTPIATSRPGSTGSLQSHEDILKALERIGDLHQKGILSDDEFKSKKAELLSRL